MAHATSLARVKHRNVVTLYTVEEMEHPLTKKPALALIMEYLDGVTFESRCGGAFTLVEVERFGLDLINGVSAIHRSDVAHGDLHEANLMLTADGLKIIDILYRDTLALLCSSGKKQKLGADVQRVRLHLYTLLQKCTEIQPQLAADFNTTTIGTKSLVDIRDAFAIALKSSGEEESQTSGDVEAGHDEEA